MMCGRVVITSGPTVEPIDPVRYISNRSSGKTGFQLAEEAKKRGYGEIIFITGPSSYIPAGVTVIKVETALQMQDQLLLYREAASVIIMAAAVGDYRVECFYPRKIKKNEDRLVLELVKNPDLLQQLGQLKRPRQILVGFAAETDHILENAIGKFNKKNLDLLVLNEISTTNPAFEVDENQVYFITASGARRLEKMSKALLAVQIWDEIARVHVPLSPTKKVI
jgi:phosphopantothenoylcysteine decarboxylase / phosphopantothenate---cysteine ligase